MGGVRSKNLTWSPPYGSETEFHPSESRLAPKNRVSPDKNTTVTAPSSGSLGRRNPCNFFFQRRRPLPPSGRRPRRRLQTSCGAHRSRSLTELLNPGQLAALCPCAFAGDPLRCG
jgi:hypothetical protein